ncbi:MAG: VIT domain-containing protein, partial [bacterium]|nr:VIT domain-containing protein [bacterium]
MKTSIRHISIILFVAAALIFCSLSSPMATGILLPIKEKRIRLEEDIIMPPMRPDIPPMVPLRVKYDKIEAVIDNQVGTTTAEQSFANDSGAVLEGTYVFPLPKGASISDFYLYINGEKTKAELLDSSKARGIYEGIVAKMRDPALLEYMESNLFKARIYPIPAHGSRKIELSYQHLLHYDAGTVRFVYPMNYASVCKQPLETLSMKVTIKSKLPIKTIYSPTHRIDINRKNEGEVVVGFEEEDVLPDKDFVLYYTVTEKDFGLTLLPQKEEDEDGYFMILVSPGQKFQDEEIVEKNVVFVFDTSGSMNAANKMDKAKEALKFCLGQLKK